MPNKAVLTLLALVIVFSSPARTLAAPDYARTGPYIGIGLGLGFENFDDLGGLDIDTGIGVDVWGGYRFLPNFAAEAQVEYLDRFDTGPLEASALTFTANLKGYALTGRLQPYALVGIGLTRAEAKISSPFLSASASDTGFSARFGGGADFFLTERSSFGVAASYVLTTGSIDGFDYISLLFGFQHRF